MQPPPRWMRRLVVAPVVFVLTTALIVLSPLIHMVAAVVDMIFDRRRWRSSRFAGVGLACCAVEGFGLFALFTTWVGSGFGLFIRRPFWVRAHTVLIGQWLELLTRALRFFLGFDFTYTYEPFSAGPQLLLCRHAGPGDAFLIARIVVRDGGRRPQMVGAAKLQWDPFLDIIGERLGFHYMSNKSADTAAELARIGELAGGLEANDVLVVFPEGGNFTPQRRRLQFGQLVERHHDQELERARGLKHTLLPKAGGISAALDGRPDAVVLFVAHAGLEGLYGLADLWSAVPLRRLVWAHAWPAQIDPPGGYAERARWLHDEWCEVDAWIERTLALASMRSRCAPE